MDNRPTYFTVNELLENDSFLCWQLFSSVSDEHFWTTLLIEHPEMEQEIDKATKILKAVKFNDYKLSSEEKDDMLRAVRRRIDEQKRKNRNQKLFWVSGIAGAAAVALLFFLNLFFLTKEVDKTPEVVQVNEWANDKDIVLILADNEVMIFEENTDILYKADGNIMISSGENKETTKKIESEQMLFNTLIVPPGKRSFLTLEDGTKVWVNSGTKLEFPPLFQEEAREIRVEGEIYIEVARDEKRPFHVNTSEMKVEVLGTRFNVTAYKNEPSQSVVLVEGKVAISFSEDVCVLQPDVMLTVENGQSKTEKVNVYNHISWKDGLLQYSNESLGTILNKLSRYYDVPIIYGEDVSRLKCDGKLVLFDTIEDVIETIYNTNPIEYTPEDGRIFIRKR